MSRIQLLKNVVDGLHSLADDIQAIADALAGDETAAAEKPQLTLEEVRAVLAEKSHDGFTKEIRELRARIDELIAHHDQDVHELRALIDDLSAKLTEKAE